MSKNKSYFNWHQLDQVTDNNRELGMEFVVLFLKNAAIYVAELDYALNLPAGEGAETFHKISHKLKGAAKSVGADNIAKLALEGETVNKNSDEIATKECERIIRSINSELKNIHYVIS